MHLVLRHIHGQETGGKVYESYESKYLRNKVSDEIIS